MYTVTNYKTKKALKDAVAAGALVSVYQLGPYPGKTDGPVALEGPHSPAAHTWYAEATIADGVIVGRVK